jgi:GTP-binding protein LepA
MTSHIRNFCIIAHIDHGKSTLADRFLECTHTVEERRMKAQYLDQLELERERGITIKMAPVRMKYRPKSQISDIKNGDGEYVLNLIDTPGHSDFSYEVSRALEAVEGAVLLVDATQGIQAQTLANFHSAEKAGLKIIGALNKIDVFQKAEGEDETYFSHPEITNMRKELASLLGQKPEEIYLVSGKTGYGVRDLLDAVIQKIPSPKKDNSYTSVLGRALIFDSFYDNHKGVVASVRVVDGLFSATQSIFFGAENNVSKIKEVGCFTPELKVKNELVEGEIGYIATGIKDPGKIKIGDTIFGFENAHIFSKEEARHHMLLGYEEPRPVIFVSFYSEESDEYDLLRQSLEKLKLNDSALAIDPDQNEVLGRGFKIGCLGRLHFEITAERLRREFGVSIINTFPSVEYKIKTKNEWKYIVKPDELPSDYLEIWEPTILVDIIFPTRYLSSILSIQQRFRVKEIHTETMGERVKLSAKMPLVELVSDFDDYMKSISEGYASFSYVLGEYEYADVVRVDLLVSGNIIPGLSRFLPKESLDRESRKMVEKLKTLLPKQQYAQPVQASAQGRIVARADIPAMRKELGIFGKNGGDRTRKMKLWKKQKRGKERLKERSEATISPNVFKELLKKE